MRIKIERGATNAKVKTGLFSSRQFTTADIRLTVDFLEEEKAVIAQSGLANYLFYDAPPDPTITANDRERNQGWINLGLGQIKVESLLGGPVLFHYENQVLANKAEADLKQALSDLKGMMVHGRPPEQPASEFEL